MIEIPFFLDFILYNESRLFSIQVLCTHYPYMYSILIESDTL